jgi:cytochrome c biogenesis protein CcmG, thiol:disulfide interchange protein DsbE
MRRKARVKLKALLFLLGGLSIGVLLGFSILFNGSNSNTASTQHLPPTVGSPVKDFTLDNLQGEAVKIGGKKGQPLVLNFWATWCPPCKEEMPLLEIYAKTYSGQVTIIGVDYGEEKNVVQQFVEEKQITFPILLDQSGIVSDMFFVRNYPMTFFIDKDGVLRAQHLGQLTQDVMVRYMELIGITQ